MLRHLALRVMVLMLFVVSQTPLLPVAAAAVVWIEGTHEVEFNAGAEGPTLVLRHQRKLGLGDSSLPQGHQHGLLTRAVLTFAQSQGGAHPDHKLSFKSTKEGYESNRAAQLSASKGAPMVSHFWTEDARSSTARDPAVQTRTRCRGEVIPSFGLVELRTVVMLI